MRATGSELVGLVPLAAMLAAGRHYLCQQQRSLGVPESEVVQMAVKSMGLDELGPFDPQKKIIEYRMQAAAPVGLTGLSLRDFSAAVAAEDPAPGGGSVAATLGALAAALGTMVANVSANKRGWDDRWAEFSAWAEVCLLYTSRPGELSPAGAVPAAGGRGADAVRRHRPIRTIRRERSG